MLDRKWMDEFRMEEMVELQVLHTIQLHNVFYHLPSQDEPQQIHLSKITLKIKFKTNLKHNFLNSRLKCDRIRHGLNGVDPCLKIITTTSFPKWRFRSTC